VTVYVFCGPTHVAAGDLDPGWVLLPPAEQGDVYRAAARKPDAIGIVDGRFQDVPAVWHKEVLWAMSRGIPVYGAASMGALRAAELAAFWRTTTRSRSRTPAPSTASGPRPRRW